MVNEVASDDFGVLLGAAYLRFVEELHAALASAGFDDLHSSFGYVFRALDADALSLRELADRLGMTPPGALKIVDEMVRTGYLLREPDPRDGRIKRLRLAPRGSAALAAARDHHVRFERQLGETLGRQRVASVRAVLEGWLGSDPAPRAAILRDV